MSEIKSHRELIAWQKSMDLGVAIYKLANGFPQSEKFGMTSQMTRSAVSVAANIAEGNARGSMKDYAHFISIARGSLMETETYVLLAIRLEYVTDEAVAPIITSIRQLDRMLSVLRERLLGNREPATRGNEATRGN